MHSGFIASFFEAIFGIANKGLTRIEYIVKIIESVTKHINFQNRGKKMKRMN
jgi:hypothetical protein